MVEDAACAGDGQKALGLGGHGVRQQFGQPAAGARDFISKPFDLLEVHKRIHNMLEVRLLYRELAQYSKQQQELALHDPLTGLPNRRLLEDRISTVLQHATRQQNRAAVMYLDLDGFKAINDTHGHAYGDEILKQVAQRLVGCSRKEDTVARVGGDEFVIVMGHILHDWDLAQKKMLLAKAFAALPKGGALIVYDAIIDDDRRKNAFGLLMSLNMLIETDGGFDYTGADCAGWMREAGFTDIRVEHLVGPDSMVIGVK